MERQSTKAGDIPVLFDDDVERYADMKALVPVMKEVFSLQREDRLTSPPRQYVKFPSGDLIFTVGGTPKTGGFRMYNTFGRVRHTGAMKEGGNPNAKPERRQVIVVFDMETNQMQGIIIGDHLSAYRSGSISAAAMDMMAPREMKTLAILGTGHHATTQLLGAVTVRKFSEIRVYSRSPDNRRAFVEKVSARIGQPIRDCASAEEAIRGADAVLSASNSPTPIYDASWVAPHAYLCSVGPKSNTATELPREIAARAEIICTDTLRQFQAFKDVHFLTGTADFDRVKPLNIWTDPATAPKDVKGIRLFLMEGLAGTEVITGASILASAKKAKG